ncbi:hypothetical protein [Streptomyces roseoviridis]|uniref:Uncharacterized protein n=1 Tax=Streptomyces roseoviridis TaxID=67361 RepID=A0ABV5QTT0_9ACTN
MPYPVSESLAERIEALYGWPRADLEAHAATTDRPTMLAALLDAFSTVELAEKNIEFQRERLLQLAAPGRDVGRSTPGHLLDCSRRIAEAVVIRDTQAQHATAVLQSLHRTPASASPPASPSPVPPTARAAHAR